MAARIVLKSVLRKKGVSRYKFAQMLNIDIRTLRRYMSADANPTFHTMKRWAKALGVKIKDLYRE